MIEKITIHDHANVPVGHWAKSDTLTKFSGAAFKPGLNILWGKNGSGKSSLLTLIARLFHAEQGRFSTITHHSLQDLYHPVKKLAGIPTVAHDGQAIAYYNPNEKVGLTGGRAGFDDDFFMEGVQSMFSFRASNGEQVLNDISSLFMKLDKLKDTKPEWKSKTDKKRIGHSEEFFKPSIDKGQFTVLLDEPDRSLDLPTQVKLWERIFLNVSKTYQVIIATHCPFALHIPSANYIELSEGYLDECRTTMGKFLAPLYQPRAT